MFDTGSWKGGGVIDADCFAASYTTRRVSLTGHHESGLRQGSQVEDVQVEDGADL